MMYEPGKGPIPGENFTSDTRNYPWHQPPEFTDLDKALDMISDKISKKNVSNGLISIVETGVPLYKVASFLLMAGVMEGKWTPDLMLLLAGPVTRILEILCVGYGVEYDLGIEEDDELVTGQFFRALNEPIDPTSIESKANPMDEQPMEEDSEEGEEPNLGSMGFMKQATSGASE